MSCQSFHFSLNLKMLVSPLCCQSLWLCTDFAGVLASSNQILQSQVPFHEVVMSSVPHSPHHHQFFGSRGKSPICQTTSLDGSANSTLLSMVNLVFYYSLLFEMIIINFTRNQAIQTTCDLFSTICSQCNTKHTHTHTQRNTNTNTGCSQ